MNEIIEQLNGIIPADKLTYVIGAWVAMQAAGRIYQSIVKGGGLKGIWSALMFGTNTPKDE